MVSHFAGAESGRTPQEGELRRITTAAIVSLSTRNVNLTDTVNPNGVSNIWTQASSGGSPAKLTDFSADRIFNFDFAPNGRQVVYARGSIRNDIVLFETQ